MKKLVSCLLVVVLLAVSGIIAVAEEPVTITFESLAWIKAEQDATREVIDAWNAEHPEIQVQLIQGDWGGINAELLTGFETGDVPDMFHYWTAPIMTWKENGWMADLSPMLDDELYDDVDEEVWKALSSSDGKIIALPYQNECDVVFYNKDMFDAAGIVAPTVENPWTLDELIENCKLLTDAENDVYGLQIKNLWHLGVRYFNEIWATKIGESPLVLNENGEYEIGFSEEYLELAEKMRNLMLVDKIVPPYSVDMDDTAMFLDGKLGVYCGIGCWQRSQFFEAETDVNWGMLPAITIDNANNYGAIQTISVTEASEHKEECMEFLRYFWSTENQIKICGAAYIFPCRKSAMAAPELNTSEDFWDLAQLGAQSLVIPDFVTVPGWGDFQESIGATIYAEYFQGMIDQDEFVERCELEGNMMLEDARG